MKRISLYLQAVFYTYAGLNHFIDPEFYYPLIPDYLPFHAAINAVSGAAEILLGLALFFVGTRRVAAYLICAMLVSFIPSHIYFVQLGSCIENGLCVPEWIGWARLLIIHPLLIWWALSVRNVDFGNR